MSNLSISLNEQAWIKTSRKLKEGSESITARVITRTATFMERTAKSNIRESVYSTPKSKFYKRTGKARQSIMRSPVSAMAQRVYMGVNYGKFIEEGTGEPEGRKAWWTRLSNITGKPSDSKQAIKMKGMKARPFWSPAIKTTQETVPRIWNEEASKIIN